MTCSLSFDIRKSSLKLCAIFSPARPLVSTASRIAHHHRPGTSGGTRCWETRLGGPRSKDGEVQGAKMPVLRVR